MSTATAPAPVSQDALLTAMNEMNQRLGEVSNKLAAATAQRVPGAVPNSAPWARKGEDIMGSRGFSFGKAMMVAAGTLMPEEAKIEADFCSRFRQKMYNHNWRPDRNSTVLVPFWPEGFTSDQVDNDLYYEMKGLIHAGAANPDWDQLSWLRTKAAASPAQSWVDQSVGGALVGPATWGAPIELLRNKEALMNLGATTVPLGPTGRLQMPRLTGATQGGWAGENSQQTPTQAKTGTLTLSAKKVIAVVALPNELLRFGSPATESLIRNDIFKTVALIMDKGFLDGQGSDNVPLGLATMGAASGNPYGMSIVTPATANTLSPQDVGSFISGVMANNGQVNGWLLRPELFYSLYMQRWTPYSGGTNKGGFVFDVVRGLDGKPPEVIMGYPAVLTPQVSITRGNGSQTYITAADFTDYLMGLFGAIEFTQTDAGFTLLSSDQTAVRAVMQCDGGPRHPGVFSFLDAVSLTAGS